MFMKNEATSRLTRISLIVGILVGVATICKMGYDYFTASDTIEVRKEIISASLKLETINHTIDGLLDVALRNTGEEPLIINRITVTKLKDHGSVKPKLTPTATYNIPLDSLAVGDSTMLLVKHNIDGLKSDNFLIDLESTNSLTIKVNFYYNGDKKVGQEVKLW